MFLPRSSRAIAASVLGARVGERYGSKRVYLAGLAASLVSMAILVTSTSSPRTCVRLRPAARGDGFLGVGFGLTVPTLNTFTAAFNPDAVDRSVLVLNALLGLGTVLAPVFVAVFVGLGFWWGLPILSLTLLVVLLLPQHPPALAHRAPRRRRPGRGRAGRAASLLASGCTPASPCSTGSARR